MNIFNSNRARIHGVLSAIFFVASTSVVANECPDLSNARPAQIVNSEANIEIISELIPSWKSDETVRLVNLVALINLSGRIEEICCTSSTHKMSAGALQLLEGRFDRLIFKPARHNGDELRVYVGFSVIANKTPDGVVVDLFMNRLRSMDKFGTAYLAPQRIWSKSMWAEGQRASGRVFMEAQVSVDAMGRASDGEALNSNQAGSSLVGITTARLESACYVPGYFEGKPTAMVYAETFMND